VRKYSSLFVQFLSVFLHFLRALCWFFLSPSLALLVCLLTGTGTDAGPHLRARMEEGVWQDGMFSRAPTAIVRRTGG
jgi:hypothetical protein